MIEAIMYMGIGFLFAGLIAVAVMPLVHDRAVRLTTRRLRAILPLSTMEVQADKDLLRAEFAMSACRFEMSLGHLKQKSAAQVVELGKRADAINRLKIQRDALRVELITLKAQFEALKRNRLPSGVEVRAKASVISLMRQWIPQRIYH